MTHQPALHCFTKHPRLHPHRPARQSAAERARPIPWRSRANNSSPSEQLEAGDRKEEWDSWERNTTKINVIWYVVIVYTWLAKGSVYGTSRLSPKQDTSKPLLRPKQDVMNRLKETMQRLTKCTYKNPRWLSNKLRRSRIFNIRYGETNVAKLLRATQNNQLFLCSNQPANLPTYRPSGLKNSAVPPSLKSLEHWEMAKASVCPNRPTATRRQRVPLR